MINFNNDMNLAQLLKLMMSVVTVTRLITSIEGKPLRLIMVIFSVMSSANNFSTV